MITHQQALKSLYSLSNKLEESTGSFDEKNIDMIQDYIKQQQIRTTKCSILQVLILLEQTAREHLVIIMNNPDDEQSKQAYMKFLNDIDDLKKTLEEIK